MNAAMLKRWAMIAWQDFTEQDDKIDATSTEKLYYTAATAVAFAVGGGALFMVGQGVGGLICGALAFRKAWAAVIKVTSGEASLRG